VVGVSTSRGRPGLRRLADDRPEISPYDLLVASQVAVRAASSMAARFSALPQRRQEQAQDAGLALALSAVNAVSLLPYRSQLHPFWLALVLVIALGVRRAWRGAWPVGAGLIIGVARVAYDRIGFGFAPFPLGPAIAVYTVVERRGRVWRWVVAGLVVAGIALSLSTPGHDEPYEAIFQALIFVAAWMAGAISRAKRISLAAATDRAERAEAEIDLQARRAAAAERTKIARELHDVVAHHVSLIAVQAEAATSLLPEHPKQAIRSVEIIGDTARKALTELRRLLGVLRGPAPALKAPLATLADLGPVLDQVRDAGLPVDLEVVGTPYPLAAGVDLTAYRIVQEALTNTLRHTQAKTASVTLSYEPDYVTVRVADPGPGSGGSSPGADTASGGFGLAGIAERVASCGGNLSVGPTQPDGFAVTARLPAR
jgi:signal transduction histidine kinase